MIFPHFLFIIVSVDGNCCANKKDIVYAISVGVLAMSREKKIRFLTSSCQMINELAPELFI